MHDMLLDERAVAGLLGGEVRGDSILAPGPGHNPEDRSMSVKLVHDAPDGFIVHSFAGDPWPQCRDHVKRRVGSPGGTSAAPRVHRQNY